MKSIIFNIIIFLISLSALLAEEYTLQDYMQLVEENSKELYLARMDQKLAENQKEQATAAVRPMIAGEIGYSRNILDITQPYPAYADGNASSAAMGIYPLEFQDITVNKDNDYSFSVGIQQTIFDMKIFKALEASKKYIDLTGTIYEANRQGILTAAKQVYYQTVLLDEVCKVKKSTEKNAYEIWEDIQLKYENELASELNVLQAEVNWQMNIPETSLAARNRDLAMSNLKHLAGIDPEQEVILLDTLNLIPENPEQAEFGDILSTRPDYQALQRSKDLNEINISMKKAEFYPSLSATAGYGWQKSDDNLNLSGGIHALQIGVSLKIPIFYGGVRFAKLEQAKLELDKTEMEILKKHDEIQTEINNLHLLINESAARIQSAETTLKTAGRAFSIIEVSTRNGLSTQLDLKDALLNLEGAKLNYYKSIYDYLNGYFKWQQAIGKGDQLPLIL